MFLSYEHHMKSVVDHICSVLEKDGIRCWYAPRDVIGDYATSIVNAIEAASIFVVVLNNAASKSMHVLNEVEIAYKRIIEKEGELTILPFKLDDQDLSKAMEYYIHRLHWIDASTQGIENAINELKSKIMGIISPTREKTLSLERHTNAYYEESDEQERNRLLIQQKLLNCFDSSVYDKLASEIREMRILDLGSANGNLIMSKLGRRENLDCLLGLEFNQDAVDSANNNFGNDKIHFAQCDLERSDFEMKLRTLCEKYSIEDFNIIHISMLILHLKNPLKLLKVVRKFTKPGSVIIIKDIDDGFNAAYPDLDGIFARAIEICSENPRAGYRNSGREIPSLLKKSGYTDITLENSGLNTLGMDFDEREAMFHIYFSFIREDFGILTGENPDNAQYKNNYEWICENYEKLEEAFMNEEFFFSLGFMLFIAHR